MVARETEYSEQIEVISWARHQNLGSLVGYCVHRRLLVYDYVPNKMLDFHLHGMLSIVSSSSRFNMNSILI